MTTNILILCILSAGAFFILIIFGLRMKLFSEGYAFLWLMLAIMLMLLPFFYLPITSLAQFIGFTYPSSLIMLGAILFLMFLTIVMSMHISKLRHQVRELAQYIAIVQPEDFHGTHNNKK